MRATNDPAMRLALVEERRVVFRDSPSTKDCRRLLDAVSHDFKLRQAEAADRIIEAVRKTEGEGDRFTPLQVLDSADLYTHSPRFKTGKSDFGSFLTSFDEVRSMGKDRFRIPERMVQLR